MHCIRCGLLLQTELRGRSVCLFVCLSVGRVREPYKNGWADRDAVWGDASGGPKEPWIRRGQLGSDKSIRRHEVWQDCDAAFLSKFFDHLLLLTSVFV